jgi:EAL domain-containing protein (putative c-di-GMP-specific phosphodiesterase class I)
MRRFVETQSLPQKLALLSDRLNIKEEIASQSHVGAYKAYAEIIEANVQLDKVLQNLNQNKMYVYYQPKINVRTGRCDQFEALIRYRNDEGKLVGPIFLDTIEKAGMAPVIDLWVSQQVRADLDRWKEEGFAPGISINLHPDTIRSREAIEKILAIMQDRSVMFEIVERSFLGQGVAAENLRELKRHHHRISIDDFGNGYSNMEALLDLQIDELKLDRILINKLDDPKGLSLCRNLTHFCHEIGVSVIAEGVETREQKETVAGLEIDRIQGWYYSPAIAFKEVKPYADTFRDT